MPSVGVDEELMLILVCRFFFAVFCFSTLSLSVFPIRFCHEYLSIEHQIDATPTYRRNYAFREQICVISRVQQPTGFPLISVDAPFFGVVATLAAAAVAVAIAIAVPARCRIAQIHAFQS